MTRYSKPQYEVADGNATGTVETGTTEENPTLNDVSQAVAAAGNTTETGTTDQNPLSNGVSSQADSQFVMVENDSSRPPTDRVIEQQVADESP